MGDSLMGQTVMGLPLILEAHGIDATVYDAHVNGSGPLDPQHGLSARAWLDQQLAAHPDVDTVLFEWAGACSIACGPGKVVYGSLEYYTAWEATVRDLVNDVRSRGLNVLWAVSPPAPPVPHTKGRANAQRVATALARYVRQYPKRLGIPVVDWWEALSDTSGHWQRELEFNGHTHMVRAPDGVHLTPDGAVRTATWTAAALSRLYSRTP